MAVCYKCRGEREPDGFPVTLNGTSSRICWSCTPTEWHPDPVEACAVCKRRPDAGHDSWCTDERRAAAALPHIEHHGPVVTRWTEPTADDEHFGGSAAAIPVSVTEHRRRQLAYRRGLYLSTDTELAEGAARGRAIVQAKRKGADHDAT